MKNSKLLIVLLSLLLVSLSGCGEVKVEGWVIVTDGECFTSKKGVYINHECFNTKEEAEEDLTRFLEFSSTKKEHKNRNWKKAN
jgi:hypothetical protein